MALGRSRAAHLGLVRTRRSERISGPGRGRPAPQPRLRPTTPLPTSLLFGEYAKFRLTNVGGSVIRFPRASTPSGILVSPRSESPSQQGLAESQSRRRESSQADRR